MDAASVLPERQLALLARIPMFAPLARTDLERLARQLDRIETPAGTEVIRQGDIGDRFYVVDAGEFEIVIDGERVRVQGEGEFFGEIALLQDMPRTATVRALTDGAVWALDQEEFLATLTGLPQAARAAHADLGRADADGLALDQREAVAVASDGAGDRHVAGGHHPPVVRGARQQRAPRRLVLFAVHVGGAHPFGVRSR